MKKRLVALLLVFAMSLSLVSPAWATEGTDITAENADTSFYAETSEAEKNDIDIPEETAESDLSAAPTEEEDAEVKKPSTEGAEDTVPVEDAEENAQEDVQEDVQDDVEDDIEEDAEKPVEENTPTEEIPVTEEDALSPEESVTDAEPTEDITEEPVEIVTDAEPTEDVTEEELTEDTPLVPLDADPIDPIDAIGFTETATEVIVTLGDDADKNFRALQDAIINVGSPKKKPVRIAEAGVYPLAKKKSTSSLHLLPNTTLDLNGATIVRSGTQMGNFIFLHNQNDSRIQEDCYDYNMCTNVTVKNGTIDGSGGYVKVANLVNIGHCTNVRFSNVNFRNGKGAHLIEFTGAKDCVVENCTFSGWTPVDNVTDPCEAVQIDISYGGANKSWNGIYEPSKTLNTAICRNITISGCTFLDYPGGVGNHHTVKGAHSTGITIKDNTFINTRDFKFNNGTTALHPAINCFAFDNCKVKNNVITGLYAYGIRARGGNVKVENNLIGSAASAFAARGIAESNNEAWVPGKVTKILEKGSGGTIAQNTVYSTSAAIELTSYAKLSSVTNNTLTVKGSYAVSIDAAIVNDFTGNTLTTNKREALRAGRFTVKNFKNNTLSGAMTTYNATNITNFQNNTVKAAKGNAISLTDTTVTAMSGNKSTAKAASALSVSHSTLTKVQSNTLSSTNGNTVSLSGSKVTHFKSNTVTATGGNALSATSSTITNALSNTLTSSSGNAVYLSKSKLAALSSNTAASTSATAFYLTGTTVTNMQKNSVSKAGKYGVYLTGKSNVTSKLNSNVISDCKQSGIYVTSNSKVKTVQSNKITGCKQYGIAVLNKKIKVTVTKNTIKTCKKPVYIKAKGTKQKK